MGNLTCLHASLFKSSQSHYRKKNSDFSKNNIIVVKEHVTKENRRNLSAEPLESEKSLLKLIDTLSLNLALLNMLGLILWKQMHLRLLQLLTPVIKKKTAHCLVEDGGLQKKVLRINWWKDSKPIRFAPCLSFGKLFWFRKYWSIWGVFQNPVDNLLSIYWHTNYSFSDEKYCTFEWDSWPGCPKICAP